MDACLHAGVRKFVHVSSPSVYFPATSGDRLAVTEEEPVCSLRTCSNEYTRSKLQAEWEVDCAVLRGLPAVTLRPRAIVGRGASRAAPRRRAR